MEQLLNDLKENMEKEYNLRKQLEDINYGCIECQINKQTNRVLMFLIGLATGIVLSGIIFRCML